MAWVDSKDFHVCLPMEGGGRQDEDLYTTSVADRTFSFLASSVTVTHYLPSLSPFSLL